MLERVLIFRSKRISNSYYYFKHGVTEYCALAEAKNIQLMQFEI